MPKKCLYRVNTPDLSQLSILNQSSLILGKKINWRFDYSNICLENKKFVSRKKSSPTDYCWFSTRMCGKNKKVNIFMRFLFCRQDACIQEMQKSLMSVFSSTSTLKPTNVSWILGLLTKARWMWPVEVTIIVFCWYCQALVSPGCRVWKPKPLFFTNQNSEFKFLSNQNFFGGLINRTGDPYIPGQARVRVHS